MDEYYDGFGSVNGSSTSNGSSSTLDYYYPANAAAEEENNVGFFNSSLAAFHIYNFVLTIVQYLLPLIVISIAYVRMGMRLWLTKTPGVAQLKRDQMILMNKKKVILIVV